MTTNIHSLCKSPTFLVPSTFLGSSSSFPKPHQIKPFVRKSNSYRELLHFGKEKFGGGIVCGALLPVDPWAPTIDSESIASQLFALSLFPYIGFLYFITKSKSAPKLTLFGFYFLLTFVGATRKRSHGEDGFVKDCLSEELKKLIRSVASEYGDVIEDMELLGVVRLNGAMTNVVYQISWPTKDGDFQRKALVRLYGKGVGVFFNREDEIRTFEYISKHGQGPRLLGRLVDGRIEEFIHARKLSAADLLDPEISSLIAAKLRVFHYLDMPFPKCVHLWNTMRKWLATVTELCSPKQAEEFSLDTLEGEIYMLEKELSNESQEIGFCHNDLQYGNIMMDEEARSITIVDYEYASYNPVAYDIANHLCEMVANYHSETPHVLDYSKYPNLEERRRFVRIYLSSPGSHPSDTQVEKLLNDVEKYTLASHLFWGLWGIISGYVNKIDFNYMEYARQRFRQYWLRKKELLAASGVSP
ncbi:Choline/ethanolamine kinase [Morus notabilis]|uniref:Choline/ethanolamine kinase n=1 Tax=Morus notabilis TaxID=981085 RepID=W9RY67_9ROSA|nr:probable choline kinase 3 [Morus notabilis]EXC02927.1 Choline/ethanolamine kinase [Morus notabilis]